MNYEEEKPKLENLMTVSKFRNFSGYTIVSIW